MREAYEETEAQSPEPHRNANKREQPLSEVGEKLFKNSLRMAFTAIGHGRPSQDVDEAAALLSQSMEWAGWQPLCVKPLLCKVYQVLLAVQPADDPEGHQYPFGPEPQIFWKAYAAQQWAKVCDLGTHSFDQCAARRWGHETC